MWTALLLLFLISSFDIGATRKPLQTETSVAQSDSSDSSLESVEHGARLPRKFRGNSRTRRLHIENQTTGFDGKVEKININSEEDLAKIRAYALRNTKLRNNGHIRTMPQMNTEGDTEFGPRVARAIEAYGKSKEHLETNGEIEEWRDQALITRHPERRGVGLRVTRSIETGQPEVSAKNTEDLEAQDAKVFRPLFVYRQQLAKRQNRGDRFMITKYPYLAAPRLPGY
ncbi:uncharacterized protein LOC116424203 [Nomia melanderi]|uniref:uncharacterized protein LOC116424203 n=1 Tax=Nomia melanderi TaxID=2448451 RepID=UPI0013043CA5|nr:uncharacterized protein LOC116424203 [Nomia melanderi]